MKAGVIALAAGGTLILAGTARGGFTGLRVVSKPNEFGLFVCNVYATFDRPGEDFMIAVAGTPLNPLSIEVVGGTFYQHPFGTDRPPPAELVSFFPSLAYDSFVTIGVKSFDPDGLFGGQPEDHLVLTTGWPGFGASELVSDSDAWFVTPLDAQGDPFNPDFVAGDGQVLIGQFATADGIGVQGTMLMQFFSNGVTVNEIVSFEHFIPAPGVWWIGAIAGAAGVRRRRRRSPRTTQAAEPAA